MAWMKHDPVEPALSSELDGALGTLRSKNKSCPDPKLIQAAQADVLDSDQAEQVNRHVQDCQLCKSLLADLQSLDDLELNKAARARIWKKVRSGMGTQEPLAKAYSWWMRPMVLGGAVAALLAVIVGVLLVRGRPSPDTLTADKQPLPTATPQPTVFALEKAPVILPASAAIIWRGQQDKAARDLKQALVPYDANNYPEAAKRLLVLRKKYPRMPEAAFYLGVSQLFLNQNEQAAATLKVAAGLAGAPLNETADWYLALADYRAGKTEIASGVLQQLCRAGGKDSARACAGVKELAGRN